VSALVPTNEALLDVERMRAADLLATTVQVGLALAIGWGKLSVDARNERPDPDAIGETIMLGAPSLGIVGCAKLTGVVTLRGTSYPDTEHPHAIQIHKGIKGDAVDRNCLWVFEHGVLFEPVVRVHVEDQPLWVVSEKHREALRAAYAAAKKRRDA
jgi:hypothetical protein